MEWRLLNNDERLMNVKDFHNKKRTKLKSEKGNR